MLIFGTRGYLYTLAMITVVCGSCGNPAAHTLKRRVTKFTLFFVPLFPISSSYSTQCTFCGTQKKLPKEQALQLQAQAAGQSQQIPAQPNVPQQAQGQNPFQG